MPVPWEAFIPMALIVTMFGVTGTGFSIAKRATNDGKSGILKSLFKSDRQKKEEKKPTRHSIDQWEDMMMKRDQRLTGSIRGQAMDAFAPKEFATNSVWNTEKVE